MLQELVPREGAAGPVPAVFTFGQRLGIVFIVEAAFLSLFSVIGLLAYISSAAAAVKRKRRWTLSTPLHVYFISMMMAELIQATGAIMNLRWIIKASVQSGSFCTTQGLLKQIGDVSVALNTLAIAIHTFTAIVFRWRPTHPRLVSTLMLGLIWFIVFLIVIVSIGTHHNNIKEYWSATQYWCWISTRYKLQQYLLDYVFMWATAFANIILYIPLSLVIRGVIQVHGRRLKYSSKEERSQIQTQTSSATSGKGVDSIAMQMLFYPLVYTLTVLPIAIVRFRSFYDKNVPFAYTVVADVLFSCSGFFNVVLFSLTRPALMPRRERESTIPVISHNHYSFSLRSPNIEQPCFSARPSLVPPKSHISHISALPTTTDEDDLHRYESLSFNDHSFDLHLMEPSPTKSKLNSPSLSSFRTHE